MSYRKLFLVAIFVSACGSLAFADTLKEQQIDMGVLGQSQLQSIKLQTCDGQTIESVLSGTIRPHQTKIFCLAFVNSSSKNIVVEYGFSEYTYTKEGNPSCSQDINTGFFFSHILEYGTSVIIVPADGFTTKSITLQAPTTGQFQGCISYRSLSDALTIGMFNVIYRKTNIIHFTLVGPYYGWLAEGKDFLVGIRNNRGFWIGVLVILGLLFLFTLVHKPVKKKHKK